MTNRFSHRTWYKNREGVRWTFLGSWQIGCLLSAAIARRAEVGFGVQMKLGDLHGTRWLRIFIGSTSDLAAERDAVQEVLGSLDVDGTRFESWPASPNPPLDECFQHLDTADGLVLLLGQKYGTITPDGISATHAEYRHAAKLFKPIFAFLLKCDCRDPGQETFVEEVRQSHWHGPEIEGLAELRHEVRRSLLQEFTRCFRKVHATPPRQLPQPPAREVASAAVELPDDRPLAAALLKRMYEEGRDEEVHAVRAECLARFGSDPVIRNIVYMVEVNRGINNKDFDRQLAEESVSFWQSDEAERRWVRHSLLYNQGNALMALRRLGEAVTKYEEALRLWPAFAECWKNLGSAHQGLGRRDLAKKCYETALAHNPYLFEASYCLGALFAEGNEDPCTALHYMNAINVETLPLAQRAAVYAWRAIFCLRLGRYGNGIACGEKAIQADPGQPWAWEHTGRLYALARREDKKWRKPALRFWRRFVERIPERGDAWSELGFTLWLLRGDVADEGKPALTEETLQAFENAIRCGTTDEGLVWDRIGHLHEDLGNLLDAERAFREAVARDRPQFLYCLAGCLLAQEKHDIALPLALESAQKYQSDAHGWSQVGTCYSNLGMFEEAKAAYEKAIGLDSGYANAWFDLGGLYWNHGRRADALTVWEDGVRRFPGHELAKCVKDLLASDGKG